MCRSLSILRWSLIVCFQAGWLRCTAFLPECTAERTAPNPASGPSRALVVPAVFPPDLLESLLVSRTGHRSSNLSRACPALFRASPASVVPSPDQTAGRCPPPTRARLPYFVSSFTWVPGGLALLSLHAGDPYFAGNPTEAGRTLPFRRPAPRPCVSPLVAWGRGRLVLWPGTRGDCGGGRDAGSRVPRGLGFVSG